MRIGIFIGNSVPQEGGVFAFADTIIESLLRAENRHEFFVFYYGPARYSNNSRIRFISISHPLGRFRNQAVLRAVLRQIGMEPETNLQKAARAHHIDIMWFLTNSHEEVRIPFILTVLDLEHRVHPFFPEVSVTGNTWESREKHFSSAIPRAAFVITGTEAGKREIIRFYHAEENNIRVLPFPAPSFSRMSSNGEGVFNKYNISQPYLFYPAQFWPHKNHVCLLHTLKLLEERDALIFSLVLTGTDKGNLNHVKKVAKDIGISSRVHFLGFVPKEDLTALYKNAFAMVFVSFFGPDNLPPLEAFALGCPVVAAKVSGAEQQLGDAALLIDPRKEEEIADAIKMLHGDPLLRDSLRERGLDRSSGLGVSNYINGMITIFEDFEKYRRCWSSIETYKHT